MNAMTTLDDIAARLERDLALDTGTLAAARRVDEQDEAKPAQADPVERQAAKHREAIAFRERRIIEIERARDIAVRGYQADLATAERAYTRICDELRAAIETEQGSAERRVALLRQLIRSSEAALVPLVPNEAAREAPMEGRMVPRPERVTVPIMRHRDVRS